MSSRRIVITAAAAGAGAAIAGAGATGVSAYFARRVVTPTPPVDDTAVRAFSDLTITLDTDEQTSAPGCYALLQDGGATHVRVGDLLATHGTEVTRELLGVDRGTLSMGPARVSGQYYDFPHDTGIDSSLTPVTYDGPLGQMPAWEVRVPQSRRWAVLVHGRMASPGECIRALRPLAAAGYNALIVTYRNDADAPAATDGKFGLGLHEWQDVEAAVAHCAAQGATEVVPMGWSMGGAIVLQLLDHTRHSDLIKRAVLDSPVIDWAQVLAFQATLNGVPQAVARGAVRLMRTGLSRRSVGLAEPLDLARANWVARADELHTPLLILHGPDDGFVPYDAALALRDARPDLVRLVSFPGALHCREWNVDPQRWDSEVRSFCAPQEPLPADRLSGPGATG